ncbi:unnamed protein product, partial [Ectocarpus fasciculatus]
AGSPLTLGACSRQSLPNPAMQFRASLVSYLTTRSFRRSVSSSTPQLSAGCGGIPRVRSSSGGHVFSSPNPPSLQHLLFYKLLFVGVACCPTNFSIGCPTRFQQRRGKFSTLYVTRCRTQYTYDVQCHTAL